MKKTCEVCGKVFEADRNQKFCSAHCRKKSSYQQLKAKRERQRLEHTRICKLCRKPYKFKHTTDKYCRTCRSLAAPFLEEGYTYEELCWKECPVCGQAFLCVGKTGGRGGVRRVCNVCAGISKESALPPPTRKCHDCGKPTDNYRCDKCLDKWRRKNFVPLRSDYNNDEDNYFY